MNELEVYDEFKLSTDNRSEWLDNNNMVEAWFYDFDNMVEMIQLYGDDMIWEWHRLIACWANFLW